jgi:subfamily B ATP-binding cassette protein MsbA
VQQLLRLWPYVRPQRRWALLAVLAAGIAAALWAGAMLLAFPIAKVLLQQQSLDDYVEQQIAAAQAAAAREAQKLAELDARQAAWPEDQRPGNAAYLRLLSDRARCQRLLGEARRQEVRFLWLRQWALPVLPDDRFDTLACLFGALLLITVLHGGTVYVQEVWIGVVVQSALRSLRAQLFRRTLRLDAQTLAAEGVPALMSRFTNDLAGIAQGLTLLGGKVLLEPFKATACIASAFAVNWRLTLLSLLCAPVGAWLFGQFGRRLKQASRRQMETVARLYQVLQETLGTFRLVTAYGNQRHHRRRLARESRDYLAKAMQINRIDALVNPSVELLGVTAACLALLPAAYLVLRHKTTIWGIQLSAAPLDLAELAALYTLLAGVVDPARKLSSCFSKVKKALAACDRVFAWLDKESLVREVAEGPSGLRHRHSLEFERVSFRYDNHRESPDRPAALDDVSLRIEFGEVVAVVGGNGSGKSTLVGLLPRFYDPRQGAVRIDGVDLRDWPLQELRSQIGWVPQEPMLFEGTVAENIALGRPGVARAVIDDVARKAFVWQFAADWPQGLETPIGDKGNRLSGGQRQRIALARAMVRDPAILVLDEATSAIDAQSEMLIHQSLREFSRGRTTLIITHAITPTLLEFVTRIVVLDHGRLAAVGRHDQLLATCPEYARLFAAQSARRAA